MHNNWITGMDIKIYRQKEMHLYVYDINGYYSSMNNKYFKIINKSKNLEEDEKIVKLGLHIASLTKSVFILPQFKCNHCKRFCKYCKNHTYCSFIEFWKIRPLNRYFKNMYRESVLIFLHIIYYRHF